MTVKMLVNANDLTRANLGFSLSEGQTGEVEAHVGEELIKLGLAIRVEK